MKLQAVNFGIIDFDMEKRKIDSLKFVVENVENWYKVLHGLRRVTVNDIAFAFLPFIRNIRKSIEFSIFHFPFSIFHFHQLKHIK